MYNTDYHFHTHLSFDGSSSLGEMVKAASKKGLNEICVTDHYECNRPSFIKLNTPVSVMRREFYNAVAANTTNVNLRFGIELGQPAGNTYQAQMALSEGGFDFVMASVHAIYNGTKCISRVDYNNPEEADEAINAYYDITEEIINWGKFDILAHFNIFLRYIARRSANIDIRKYYSRMEKIFKMLSSDGKGLEINATSFYQPLKETLPNLEILKLYKDCGGEIITVGSDAHEMNNIGRGTEMAVSVAKDAGFNKIALFKERNVSFVNI